MDVEIKKMPALRTAGLRHLGSYQEIGEAFNRLHAIVGPPQQQSPNTSLIAIYHDDPEMTPEPELRSDAAIGLAPEASVPTGLREQRLPAGRYACALHRGSYKGLPQAWSELLGQWLPLSGHRLGPGPRYEIYLNTPMDTAEDELCTQLYLPLD
jgi:AraC family transcriptional regulator